MTKFSDLTTFEIAAGGGTVAALVCGFVAYATHDRRPRVPASHIDCTYITPSVIDFHTDIDRILYVRRMKDTRWDGKVCAGITIKVRNTGESVVVLKDE